MFGSSFVRTDGLATSSAPSHFKDSARNAIYQQLPLSSGASSIRSAPSYQQYQLFKSLNSSIFSKRSARSAPSLYSSSTATIPEEGEMMTLTVEQLVNDIQLHESFYKEQYAKLNQGVENNVHKISLGSELQYQTNESLLDWNLNVTRCKLILIQMPMVSSIPNFIYSHNALPLLTGDLSKSCQIILIQPHITDKELIHLFCKSDIYQEHNLDAAFKRSVAEVSVKQSRLLQINSLNKSDPITSQQTGLEFKYKEIAIRNYLINLAAAATTAYEYKVKSDESKKLLASQNKKAKLTREYKKILWDQVRLDVFKRAGLEE